MIFLTAFISAIFDLLRTTLCIYYLAAIFVASSAVVARQLIKMVGGTQ